MTLLGLAGYDMMIFFIIIVFFFSKNFFFVNYCSRAARNATTPTL